MPELPEVETTRRGIAPHLSGQTVVRIVVREPRLRWPIPQDLDARLCGQIIDRVDRRAKYLLLRTEQGTALLHLGMSGSLRLLPRVTTPGKHDHVDIELANGSCLRFNDPRRFGALLWSRNPPESHPLLRHLGPEPFADAFNGAYLHALARSRRTPIKAFIMNARVVVGVGNIYANEALFAAAIHPSRGAGRISLVRCERLVEAIREVLADAIAQGGTTLRNFSDSSGRPGYFQQRLKVYGLDRHPCPRCGACIVLSRHLGQRATYYCAGCQH